MYQTKWYELSAPETHGIFSESTQSYLPRKQHFCTQVKLLNELCYTLNQKNFTIRFIFSIVKVNLLF